MGDCIFKLDQLIPFEKMQVELKRFSTSVGMGCAIVGREGQVVCAVDWQCSGFCKNLSGGVAPALRGCVEIGNLLPGKLANWENPFITTCNNGLSIAVAAIVVEGAHLASLLVGYFPATSSTGGTLGATAAPQNFEAPFSPETIKNPDFHEGKDQRILGHLELFAELLGEKAKNALNKQEVHTPLIASEERYRCLIDTLPQIVFEVDLQGKLIFANQSAYAIFGYAPQEITNEFDFYFFLPPYEHERVAAGFKQLLSGELLDPEEYYFMRKDGSLFPAIVFSRPFYLGNEVRGVRGIIVDVTLRKLAEDKLMESEHRYMSLFEGANDAIFIFDQHAILYCNEKAVQMFRRSRQELIGTSPLNFLPVKQPDGQLSKARVEEIFTALQNGSLRPFELSVYLPDGSILETEVSLNQIELAGKISFHAIVRDISERKRMEESLQKKEALLQSYLQAVPVALVMQRERARIVCSVNRRFCEIVGYDLPDLHDFDLRRLYENEEEYDRVGTVICQTLREQETCYVETRFRRGDGSWRDVSLFAANINKDDPETGVAMVIQDITPRKRIEEALRRSEERFAFAIQATSDAIWEWNPETDTTYFSHRWYEMLGYADQELPMTFHTWKQLCHPDDYQPTMSCIRTSLESSLGQGYRVEFRMRHRDGHWIWILSRGNVVKRNEAGKPWVIAGTNTDITMQKSAEHALRESEKRYKILFETSSNAILIIENGIVKDCNNKTLELFQGSRQEIIGCSPEALSIPLQIDCTPGQERKGVVDFDNIYNNIIQLERPQLRLDGTFFYAEVTLRAVDLSGEKYLLVIIRDITKRKNSEKALLESEFRFRSFYNTNPEGIILINFHGVVINANNAFLKGSGYSLAEVVSGHFKDFIPEEHQGQLVALILEIKSGHPQNQPLETYYIAKNGAIVPISVKGWLVMDERNEPLYMGFFIRDLTKEMALAAEKIALEKQVIQAQKIEAVGTLTSGIAHDFNNILGGIIGFTELASHNDFLVTDSKKSEYLKRALEACNRAKELVQQILRFSRFSAVIMAPISLKPLIKETIGLLRSTLPTTIEIRQQFDVDRDWILADPSQIHQVVMNLCTNAYQAMRENGGVMTVSLEQVTLTAPKEYLSMKISPGEYLHLCIADTGSGMDSSILKSIFEPYFTTKKPNEGTGLGLAVTQGIIKSHKGLIEVSSTLGEGSTFDIFLPVIPLAPAENETDANRLIFGQGERVFVVDDEVFFTEVVQDSLKLLGYQVTASLSSRETLEMFRNNPNGYDLLITDQTMPELTGALLAQEIRAINKTMPIILCTGFSETVTETSIGYYGITRFLMKPVNINDLSKVVHEVLVRRQAQ